ncbi:MAG: outer membrane lipoprotein-sorting protein [Deltaproteobacteria bacterium]|nr:outer membrane lipoprotein-sorting protein [Deltaproteobacteria bacterium]
MLPLKREYYDPAGALWKVETFEKITVIDGIPTLLLVRMADVRAGFTSELRVSEVRYNTDLPDSLFDPTQLAGAADADVWRNLGFRSAATAQSVATP